MAACRTSVIQRIAQITGVKQNQSALKKMNSSEK